VVGPPPPTEICIGAKLSQAKAKGKAGRLNKKVKEAKCFSLRAKLKYVYRAGNTISTIYKPL
jgi:hypothetical protein